MTNSLFGDDAYQPQVVDPWDENSQYAPTPGNFSGASLYSPSPAPDCTTDQLQSDQLKFLPLVEWRPDGEYDEQPPRYVCYTIAWKLILNRKTVGKVTEEDLVVAPSDYWEESLKADVEDMLQPKKKRHQRVRSEGTAVTISVNDRSQRNLENFYNSTNINWKPVEKQLRKWSNLLRIGRKLTIDIAFNYREDDDGHSMPSSRRVEKRGRVSATSRMLADREAHIEAEEESTGRPSTWSRVYELMRCNVRSCPLKSDWCWEDPKDKKHYKLRSSHLERLIGYVDDGGVLDGHGDVPSDIRRDLSLESQTGKKTKKTDLSTTAQQYPTIINVLPAQAGNTSTLTSSLPRPLSDEHVVIPGPREEAVREYCKWLESRATDEAYKADFRRICQVTLENHLDLELILEDCDTGFYVQRGIQIGTARRFLRDINEWATVKNSNMCLNPTDEQILNLSE
ncbi:hypothetical protein N7474_010103 [Penicillium riverlandense]|uniref:uncharacterized protein n=1 Tax=Penicillium riverlandense TaxID=1903569 RepID=UPI002548BAB2|nr:uncharacterized protein N7474_010103 [Penicillium riverlandense]KAJ5808834.1 hypothetical protein N7474_010103 [Penicillium riverlandense]